MSYSYQFTENFSTPTTPQTPFPWEVEQAQDTNHHLQQPQVYSLQHEEQLPQPERIVPSQQREVIQHKQIQLFPMEVNEGRSEFERDNQGTKTPADAEARRRSKSASTSPAASMTMPVRVSPSRAHTVSHPYKRPQTSSGKQRLDYQQHVRFVAPITGSAASPGPSSRVTSTSSIGTSRCAVRLSRLVSTTLINPLAV
jgi:hypothetical protein